jgi:hypothetical protein
MGHWSEALIADVDQDLREGLDRQTLVEILGEVGRELDVLTGRSFQPLRRGTSVFEPNGLPFVEVPDLRVGSVEDVAHVWEVPDPVNPELATVLQVSSLEATARKAMTVPEALWIAGQLIADASGAGRLSASYVLHWLGNTFDHGERRDLFRRVMDPAVRFSVPALAVSIGGWWFQIARRLIWVTGETEDEGRLIEPLFDRETAGGTVPPLAATEPVLIAAPMTEQPVNWAFAARIWPEGTERSTDRPWRVLARAVHNHGLPTVTVDSASTRQENACQVILKGYWHGYIAGDEPVLADAIEAAYPQPVERIRRHTRSATSMAAAALLLEQLIHPGYDPAQGAEATRRYVRRKASIVVMEHRKRETPDRYPWTQIGISERRFYKLLPLFAEKVGGRYQYDHDDVIARMKAHLNNVDSDRAIRTGALELLRSRGFKDDAARKWLQRHRPEEALDAWPHGRQPIVEA